VYIVRVLTPHCGNVKSHLISSKMSAEEVGEKGKERERVASHSTLLLLPDLPLSPLKRDSSLSSDFMHCSVQ
jgi:hypothetical protein